MSNVLSPDQIAALLKRDKTPEPSVGFGSGLPSSQDRTGMIWCEFCKGWYYEEYHYGDTDE